MIDLAQLQIPGPDVVPEADRVDFQIVFNAMRPQERGWHVIDYNDRVAASLARRCRELEAEVERLKKYEPIPNPNRGDLDLWRHR